jgi:glutaredoxin
MELHPRRRSPAPSTASARAAGLAALAALAFALPAAAQYKVVGPDGRITYTDRPPAEAGNRIVPFAARGAGNAAPDAALPLELRTIVARFPVTLYVAAGTCDTCDAARTLLRSRGVPHDERSVAGADDLDALVRATGGRDLPALRIGAQALRAFSAEQWNGYLDTAGYPRDSRLPAGWRWPVATPLVEPRASAAAPTAAQRRPPPAVIDPQVEPPPAEPPPIRF